MGNQGACAEEAAKPNGRSSGHCFLAEPAGTSPGLAVRGAPSPGVRRVVAPLEWAKIGHAMAVVA
jgi:hypothetical protein